MAQTATLVALARNPVPSGAVVGMFEGYDGRPMRFARWEPTRTPHRGTVCCFTGRSEFIERYFETIADLRRRGFARICRHGQCRSTALARSRGSPPSSPQMTNEITSATANAITGWAWPS